MRTNTFIGSSSEGITVAQAMKTHLSKVTDVVIWTEGVFLPGFTYVETLEQLLDKVDYAVLIASPDDLLRKREIESLSMRDNVLLELGLFMAKLGRQRTYLVTPRSQPIHIPTDLLGVKTVNYDIPTDADLATATLAIANACQEIERAMNESAKTLSNAKRRLLIKDLLLWINKIQGLLIWAQSESIKSVLDKSQFERIRRDLGARLVTLLDEQKEDISSLQLTEPYENLKKTMTAAIADLPFPEEAVISNDELMGGLLSHFVGERSMQDQVSTRINTLIERYEQWWNKYRGEISRDIGDFQFRLINML